MLTVTKASAHSCGFPTKDSVLPECEMHRVLNAEIGSLVVFSLLKVLNFKEVDNLVSFIISHSIMIEVRKWVKIKIGNDWEDLEKLITWE